MEPIPHEATGITPAAARFAGWHMTDTAFEFEEVGQWSEIKLDIVEKYGAAYAKILRARKPSIREFYYIDGFSGAGVHISRQTGQQIEGSPARALRISPSFDRYYFIDLNPKKTKYLQGLCKGRSDVSIHTGDCNEYLSKKVLPKIKFKFYNRALCLLDPYGLHLDWNVIFQAGQSKAVDMFLNFPVMDMNRNAIWRRRDLAPQEGIERMNRFWGDESWGTAAYVESPQQNLFGDPPDLVKQDNDAIVKAFRERLQTRAGFKFVPEPLPMTNSNNAVVYYLFFASQKPVAEKIIEDIFRKYRT
jgi:three-Cys-motif partner protein